MSVLEVLEQFLMKPVELLMEVIYSLGLRFITTGGITVIFLSVVINIPALLLYRWCESAQIQRKEKKNRNTKTGFLGSVEAFVFDHISLSLLLEILLFTAAYLFFTGFYQIWGESFRSIQNLGKPDRLLKIGAYRFNLLPICAFMIRILSDLIRLKGTSKEIRIQNLLVVLLFFGVLYFSPSDFALYRLVGECIFLLYVLLSKQKNNQWIISIGISVSSLFLFGYRLFFFRSDSSRKIFVYFAMFILMQIPLVICILSKKKSEIFSAKESRTDRFLFLVSAGYLTLLTGVLIPSTVIQSAPTDFINIMNYYSPLWYVTGAFLLAAGTFIFWFGIIYKVAPSPVKRIIALAITIISVCGTVNSMFFGNKRGIMSSQLEYERMPEDSLHECLVNLGILLIIAILLIMIWKKKKTLLCFLIMVLSVTKTTTSIVNLTSIDKTLDVERENIALQLKNYPEIPLSKQGKNVVVFMMDRSIGYFVPFIMAERLELTKKFDGFTYYPNTVSFGSQTNEAAPALFGGYEYTPARINERNNVPLAEKHDEALKLLPMIFDDAGYEVTVIDPPYAGYQLLSDLSIFNGRPNIHAYRANGRLLSSETEQNSAIRTLHRNFFCFSVFRIAPLFLQPTLYASGSYNRVTTLQGVKTLYTAEGVRDDFEHAYNVLQKLPAITKIIEENKNTYMAIDNLTAHEPVLLQLPDYTPAETVNNYGIESSPVTRTSADGRTIVLDSIFKLTHYHVNMASFLLIGEWMDYLRENGVFDNTRIIIVADHGYGLGFTDLLIDGRFSDEITNFNPVLMVKDFDSSGFSVDERFMTNADIPVIALNGLISDPVNPFTGNPVSDDDKTESDILIKYSEEWDIRKNNGNSFLPGRWYCFSGNDVYDPNNWKYLDRH